MAPVVKDFSSVVVFPVSDSGSELQGRYERRGFAGALGSLMRACGVQWDLIMGSGGCRGDRSWAFADLVFVPSERERSVLSRLASFLGS